MIPKSDYMKLNKAEKAAVKKKLGSAVAKKVRKTKKAKGNILGRAGRYLGQMVPYVPQIAGDVGEYLGNKLGRGIGSVFGHGDYVLPGFNVQSNTLIPGDTPPQFGVEHGDRVTRVRHREYIGDVFSSTGFTIQGYYINPGLGSTFPWLSAVAGNYECYRIRGMLFEFKSMSSDALNSTNTALGSIIMATQYNAASSNFASKQQMENYEFAQSCKPSQCMLHYIECERGANPLSEQYIRVGSVPSGQSAQLYDIGQFFLATTGMQAANVNLGELWVTYDIELLKPKLIEGQYGYQINYNHGKLAVATTSNYFAGYTAATGNNLTVTVGATTITFPAAIVTGTYQITYLVLGTGGTAAAPTIAATTNCSLNLLYGSGAGYVGFASGTTAIASAVVNITGPSAVITWSGGTMPTGMYGDIIISQMNGLAN